MLIYSLGPPTQRQFSEQLTVQGLLRLEKCVLELVNIFFRAKPIFQLPILQALIITLAT